MKKIIIFLGPPGSGKGSLSSLCIEYLQWVQLSTGNLCRKHIAEQTDIGQAIDAAIKAGKLVDDQVITRMVNQWLEEQENHQTNIILDGYPRTVPQACDLMNFVSKRNQKYSVHVIRLTISNEHVVVRLGGRAVCQNKECQAVYSLLVGSSLAPKDSMTCDKCAGSLIRRADDEAVEERLKTYYKHEQNLLDYYLISGIEITKIQVEKSLPDIFYEFKQILGLQHP